MGDLTLAVRPALKNAKQNTLAVGAWQAEGAITGNVQLSAEAAAAAVLAAQTAFNAQKAALLAFEARNPADPQAAAQIVDAAITDPVVLKAAREGAARQWLKVIALDYGADGITRTALPDSNCYGFNSCSRPYYKDKRLISCVKSPRLTIGKHAHNPSTNSVRTANLPTNEGTRP